MWQTSLGILVTLGLVALLARRFYLGQQKNKAAPFAFFKDAEAILREARISAGETVGTMVLTGYFNDQPVQAKAIADTLALRKLPSLWLMVTLPGELPLAATFDLMMRPAGPTTFSNFDHLPATLATPPDFPANAVIRSDDPGKALPAYVVAPHLQPFFETSAKELLITPKGLRMVVLLAQADRARYGVFRQADFGDYTLDPGQLEDIIKRLQALRTDIVTWSGTAA